jgi:hypothetical protein
MIRNLIKNHPYKLTLFWALVIFALCSMPGRFIPSPSWHELLSFDKWVHAGIFFVLVSLACAGVFLHEQPSYLVFVFCILAIIYGGLLELMQAKVFSERSADWQDFVANSFGCLLALVLYRKINGYIFK